MSTRQPIQRIVIMGAGAMGAAYGAIFSDGTGKNFIELDNVDTMQLVASKDIVMSTEKISFEIGSINLGTFASLSLTLGEPLAALFDIHWHMTPLGYTSPPAPPHTAAIVNANPATAFLSSYVKVRANI